MGVRRALLTGLFGLFTIVPLVYAGPENPSVGEVVTAVKDTYRSVNTIRADFTQVVTDPVTKQQDRQRGRLVLKRPKKMKIEFLAPNPRTFMSNGKFLWIYDPVQKQVIEQQDLGGGGGVGVLLDDLSKLDELFSTTLMPEDKPPKLTHTLRLVPRQQGAFQSLDLTVTKQKYVLQDLILTDAMGSVTEMHFTLVRIDTDVPDAEFEFVPPPGVQVIKAG